MSRAARQASGSTASQSALRLGREDILRVEANIMPFWGRIARLSARTATRRIPPPPPRPSSGQAPT